MDEGRASNSAGFGALLRQHRLAAGLSQEALAERARMSSHGISALERGYRRTPHRETLALLAVALSLADEQRREFELAARTGFPRKAGSTMAPIGNGSADAVLPVGLTSFVGRETELEEIAALVRSHRLVTLTGTGGVGKTQTALQAGSGYDGAVSFVALAPISDSSFVLSAIASAVGAGAIGVKDPLQSLLDHLRGRAVLLILDNCEQVVAEAARLAEAILANCAGVRILATSREALNISGEQTYRLPSLSPAAALELFKDRACAVDRRFTLAGENAAIVAEICRRLDGIPLAIELAAARVSLLSPANLAERLNRRFEILTGGKRTALPRQQTMRAAIDWSYDLLTPGEQRLFERLSVFAGGATLEAAAALYAPGDESAQALFAELSSLVDKSLVVAEFEGGAARYRVLESFREYGREKLAARGEERAILSRHAAACLVLAERLDDALRLGRLNEWHVLTPDEVDNWRVALQWALADGNEPLLGQRLAALLPVGSMPIEGRQWVRAAIARSDAATPRDVAARLHFAEGMAAFALREFAQTVASCETAIELYRPLGDARRLALAQDMAGHALTSLGRTGEAKALIEDALESARRLGDRRLLAWTLRCLAYANAKAGDLAAAQRDLNEVMPVYREHFNKIDLAYAMNDLGMYEFCAGDAEPALRHATEMLGIVREIADGPRSIVTALNAIALYLVTLERYEDAEARAREALALAAPDRLEILVAYALHNLAAVAALRPHAPEMRERAHARSARMLGWVDDRLQAMGSSRPMSQDREYPRVLDALRDSLGSDGLVEYMAAGGAMTFERALEEAAQR